MDDMDHMDHMDHTSMGDSGDSRMGMGMGTSSVIYQQTYWIVIAVTLALFLTANVYARYLSWQRARSKAKFPSKPITVVAKTCAAITATLRELSTAPIFRFTIRGRRLVGPSIGKTVVILLNIAALLILSFHGFDPTDFWQFEDIGYRLGRITVCQLPLLFLLAGKRNLLALVVGSSYERINWLHRWAARTMLLTATIHMGYWLADWYRYDFIADKMQTDLITQRGMIAWGILVWIVFSSMTPIRGWAYELFVLQHIISFAAFVTVLYYHIPDSVKLWIWFSVAVFLLDRLLRAASYIYNNLFNISHASAESRRLAWGSEASFTTLPGGCTKITIKSPAITWKPGQHVFLSCHALAPLQAHPFTIASIPSDKEMTFIVQSRSGGTRRFQRHASSSLPGVTGYSTVKTVAIEGPYGHVRPLQQFGSVLMIAGGAGATFTTPLLRDVVYSCQAKRRVVTRRIKYVWVVKSRTHLEWFHAQLSHVVEDVKILHDSGVKLSVTISLFITCDDDLTLRSDGYLQGLGFDKTSINAQDNTRSCCGENAVELGTLNEKATADTVINKPISTVTVKDHKNCCCRNEIDETDLDAPDCTCNNCGIHEGPASGSDSSSGSGSDSSTTSFTVLKRPDDTNNTEPESTAASGPTTLLHPTMALYSGRPKTMEILRSVLEEALGETAVVACGPKGLIDDVRIATVRLSDERAVNRGTGADGIWLHTEAFGY